MQNAIETRILSYEYPSVGPIFIKKNIKSLSISNEGISLELALGFPIKPIQEKLIEDLKNWLAHDANRLPITIKLTTHISAHAGKSGLPAMPNVKNIIAVASGKGGVGKSTVAVNLALALSHFGAHVGLLDADIYGPSQPTMLGTNRQKPTVINQRLQPIVQHGIESMSIGYLVDQHAPLVWRGPMLGKALQQLLQDTEWHDLDYLIVDLPPGTGDVQLTLCQKIPVSGALIVTTPQDLALVDVRRACEMFAKLGVPILGVVENMSTYHCPNCGHEAKIFGEGAANKLVQEYQLTHLGAVPLTVGMREMTDSGFPPVIQDAESVEAKSFKSIALKTAIELDQLAKDYSAKFPKIVVQHDKNEG